MSIVAEAIAVVLALSHGSCVNSRLRHEFHRSLICPEQSRNNGTQASERFYNKPGLPRDSSIL
jgi:hypothetical protein